MFPLHLPTCCAEPYSISICQVDAGCGFCYLLHMPICWVRTLAPKICNIEIIYGLRLASCSEALPVVLRHDMSLTTLKKEFENGRTDGSIAQHECRSCLDLNDAISQNLDSSFHEMYRRQDEETLSVCCINSYWLSWPYLLLFTPKWILKKSIQFLFYDYNIY